MSDKAIVCNGAICKCKFGISPDKFTVISRHKQFINEKNGSQKMVGSSMDIGQPFQAKTFGQCKMQPTPSGSFLPCIPTITQWTGFYDKVTLSNQGKILLEDSKGMCAISGSPCVEFTFHGQVGVPSQSQALATQEEVHAQMNPLASFHAPIEAPVEHELNIK